MKRIRSVLTSVRGKSLVGFAIIILLVLIMVVGNFYQLTQVQAASAKVVPGTKQIESTQEFALIMSSLEANLNRFFVTEGVDFEEDIRTELNRMSDILITLQAQPIETTEETIAQLSLSTEILKTSVLAYLDADRSTWSPNDLNRALINLYQQIDEVNQLQQQLSTETLVHLQNVATSQQSIIDNINAQIFILGTAVFLIAIGAAFVMTRTLRPIGTLTEVALSIADGNLGREAPVESDDEIGTLAQAFNSMTGQLRDMVNNLEQRVAERTRVLEASMDVSRSLSTILDQQQLVSEVVAQVQTAFNYYHVHIYILDENTNDLVMAGGTGEAGQALLDRGHKIMMGTGLVGRAAINNETVLVEDVAEEDDWLPNPLLPDTQAELAVPIAIGEQILGVIDVQQNTAGSLTDIDWQLLQSVANQVAIALRNARLYEEAQTQAQRQTIVNSITQKLQTAADIESVLKITAQELSVALQAKRTAVQLSSDHIATPGNGEANAS